MSWTRSYHIAEKFALYGLMNVDPLNLPSTRKGARKDGVILAAYMHGEIVCAPCLLGYAEGEFIVDPRNVNVGIIPVWNGV